MRVALLSLFAMVWVLNVCAQTIWHTTSERKCKNDYISFFTTAPKFSVKGADNHRLYHVNDNGVVQQLKPLDKGSEVVIYEKPKEKLTHSLGQEIRIYTNSSKVDVGIDKTFLYKPTSQREDRPIVLVAQVCDTLCWRLSVEYDRRVLVVDSIANYSGDTPRKVIFLGTKQDLPKDIICEDVSYIDDANDYKALKNHFENSARNKKVRSISSVVQRREPQIYEWQERHNMVLQYNRENNPQVVVMGNSIMHYFGGMPSAPIIRNQEAFSEAFGDSAVNMGFGWDRTENLLWRIDHDALYGISPKTIFINIGVNNILAGVSVEETMMGIETIAKEVKREASKGDIILVSVLPARGYEQKITLLNSRIKSVAQEMGLRFLNIYDAMVDVNGKVNDALYLKDGVHPSKEGYSKIAPLYKSYR